MDERDPPLNLWLQLLIGFAAGTLMCAVMAVIAILGVPMYLFSWLIVFVITWFVILFSLRAGMRGIAVGIGIATFTEMALLQAMFHP
jgi:hypothetical protein